ncbi:hypothetical protein CC2G_009743 [Coprinopsis cinerea AmutBmut pab1-1]|nr:hypothetical protein CC2G_009743 [Coprinopsis cinerea AmutBmut pab1-1]
MSRRHGLNFGRRSIIWAGQASSYRSLEGRNPQIGVLLQEEVVTCTKTIPPTFIYPTLQLSPIARLHPRHSTGPHTSILATQLDLTCTPRFELNPDLTPSTRLDLATHLSTYLISQLNSTRPHTSNHTRPHPSPNTRPPPTLNTQHSTLNTQHSTLNTQHSNPALKSDI